MGPDTVHLVEHAVGLPVKVAFDAERRKLIGDDPQVPARGVALAVF
jgi:hypothetical protein